MALTLVKEDGTGKSNANTYALVADGDAYHEGHLYNTAWTGANNATKEAVLVMATRLIDSFFHFEGIRAVTNQALAWPRSGCPDVEGKSGSRYVPNNAVPSDVVAATCETARALIVEDRTANPSGEGLKFLSIGDLQQSFDKNDQRPVLPRAAQALLAKYGASAEARSGSVRLERA